MSAQPQQLRAHTRYSRSRGARGFLDEAERQLELSRSELREPEAIVFAYRAALRAAGALIEWEMATRKRRPSGSAWAKLRVLRPDLEEWAETFEVHARAASRAGLGLNRGLPENARGTIYRDACELVDLARGAVNYLPEVA
ncbi:MULTISPECIES: SAV_6107 family HEPN domain-containing protein [unclassified Corynebacterium]|uniref:SAV_6107 family HEPN domain-containing protein n=1 Tax=unclassified Corynebacterium TaxID=2624378 RepID=UPI001EF4F553|nr:MULTISPECIES: SAV_6107 family HEPN domain-containing protein [unclassified Corynebacterium]MCG7258914.1 SAV_6107 family HEPN domain-containing protein [Corynebacterium sp. ACRQK]MCG7263146.1 SAV_6107 family HEPN domain-containing protein [Corynebacterium sp. ACRQL]